MYKSEEEYVKQIGSLQEELADADELCGLYEKRIKELEIQVSVLNSSTSGVSKAKLKKYQDKINELDECLSLFTTDEVNNKKCEISEYFKSIIALRIRVDELAKRKKVRDTDIESVKSDITDEEVKLLSRLSELNSLIHRIQDIKHIEYKESSLIGYINDLTMQAECISDIVNYYTGANKQLKDENKQLKSSITEFTGDKSTIDDWKNLVVKSEQKVNVYKEKISGLEYEIKCLKSTK